MIDDDQTHPPASLDAPGPSAPQKLVVAGQGYVGLPVAMRAVEVGYRVVGFDPDVDRVKRLISGESYVEDVSNAALREALATERYTASSEARACRGFDYAVITVPTPLTERAPDLSYIESAASTLARYLRPGATVILESTTYPGTTEELVVPILEEGSGLSAGEDFHVGYSPERIDPGNTRHTFVNTPKVVSGVDAASLRSVQDFYETLVDSVVPVSGTAEAELTKLLENTFRHVNVALGERARHVRRRHEHRHLRGDRGRVDQALRVHALRARSRRGWPLPARSTRATSPGASSTRWVGASGSSSWRTTSTTTCPTTSSGGSPRR